MTRNSSNTMEAAKTSSPSRSLTQEQMQQKIRETAQKLFEKRGRVPGHELEDWLEAEKMVKRNC